MSTHFAVIQTPADPGLSDITDDDVAFPTTKRAAQDMLLRLVCNGLPPTTRILLWPITAKITTPEDDHAYRQALAGVIPAVTVRVDERGKIVAEPAR